MGAVYNAVEVTAKKSCTRLSKSYPTKINSNYYSPFLSDDDDKNTVVVSNCSKGGTQHKALTADITINFANENETMFNTSHIKIPG